MQVMVPKIAERQMIEVNNSYKLNANNMLLNQHFSSNNTEGISQSVFNNIIIIHIMLQSGGLAMDTINKLCTAGALINSALDTHEKIEKYSLIQITSKQLTVLAGDLYSSRYYQLLADANLVDAIHIYAKSIQQINEAKMNRHFASYDEISINKYLLWLEQINASIALNLVEEYAIDKTNWHDICRNILIAQALIDEQKYLMPSFNGFISFKLVLLYEALGSTSKHEFININFGDIEKLNFLFEKHNIHRSYCTYIEQYLSDAIQSVEKLQTKYIKDELIIYLEGVKNQYVSQTIANK